MIAGLSMYDRPETADANDRLWQGVRTNLGYGPKALTRDGDLWEQWLSPDLVLSQTCGYPYRARLHGKVTLVGTPVYDLDCPPGHYYSAFVARRDDPRTAPSDFADARFAYNEALSQSGWAAPQIYAASRDFTFANPIKSDGHRLSALAVAEGRADIAAIDGLTWDMLTRYDGFAKNLRVLDRTDPTPVLPYITALGRDADALYNAVEQAISSLSANDRITLGLKGITWIASKDYLAVPNPAPAPAD